MSNLYRFYRHFLVFFAVGMFFTSVANYTERYGLIPLLWIGIFAVLSGPLVLYKLSTGKVKIPPIATWCAVYLVVSIAWFYESPQDDYAFQAVQTRVLAVIFIVLALIVLSEHQEQVLAQKWIAGAVVLAAALNVYELFNPMTFSDIPGRSQGLYPNVNQSGAALVLGLILSYQVIPDRLKLAFVGITAVGLIPTFSRSAIIGWLIVVGYFFIRTELVIQIRRLVIMSIVIIGLVASPLWGDLQYALQNRGVLNMNVIQRVAFFTGGQAEDGSSTERRAVAAKAWEHFAERPVTGWGTGSSNRMEGFDVGTHNIYLAMLAEHGLIGLFILPILLFTVLWGTNRRSFDTAIPWLIFMLVWGMFSHNVLEERYILLSMALTSSIVATRRARTMAEPKPVAPTVTDLTPAMAAP